MRVKSDIREGRDEREVHWHPRCFSTDSALYGRKVIPQPNKKLCAVLLPSNVIRYNNLQQAAQSGGELIKENE